MAQKGKDITGKNLIALVPEDWIRWATNVEDIGECEVLDTEFQLVSRKTDALVSVKDSAAGKFLTLFEIQTRYTTEMPYRMRAYAALAEAKFRLPVYPVLINILPYGLEIPTSFQTEFLGIKVRQDYRVINLWEIEAEEIFVRDLVALIPLIPTMKNGTSEETLKRAQTRLKSDKELRESGKLGDMEMALQIFAKAIIGDKADEILRWTMIDLIIESPFYQEIVNKGIQEGIQKGIQQGLEQGLEQGRKEESQKLLLKQLSRKFGELDENIEQGIAGLSLEQGENLAEMIFDIESVSDLKRWLETNGESVN